MFEGKAGNVLQIIRKEAEKPEYRAIDEGNGDQGMPGNSFFQYFELRSIGKAFLDRHGGNKKESGQENNGVYHRKKQHSHRKRGFAGDKTGDRHAKHHTGRNADKHFGHRFRGIFLLTDDAATVKAMDT